MTLHEASTRDSHRKNALTLVLLECLGELVDGGGHLESLHEDTLLSLDTDILWPLDETGQVSLWLDVSSESEVSGSLLEEGARSDVSSRGGGALLWLDDGLSLGCFLNLQQS